jgi:hypothetical protein
VNKIDSILIAIIILSVMVLSPSWPQQSVVAKAFLPSNFAKAPVAISAENVYVSWWTNDTGNDEIMFRVSNDSGATFAEKINLSNSTNADSQDVEIAADGSNVVVTWWERNQTAEEPVVIISSDNGVTFGPILRLATNGTIGLD